MKDQTFGVALSDLFARERQAGTLRAGNFRPPEKSTIVTLYQQSMIFAIGAGLVAMTPWITKSLGGSDAWINLQPILETIGFWGGLIFLAAGISTAIFTTLNLEQGRRELRDDAVLRQEIYHRLRYVSTDAGTDVVFDPVTGKEARPTYIGIQTLVKNLRNHEA